MRTVCRTQPIAVPTKWASIRLAALALGALLAAPIGSLAAEAVPTRFRVTLESPEPIAWRGSLSLSEGRLEKLQPLNLDATAAAGSSLSNGELQLHHRRAVARDVFDITVRAANEAELTLTLPGLGNARVPLAAARETPQTARVGDSALVLSLSRLASDRLRVESDRRSLIFEPGEEFAFDVLADPAGIERGRPWEFVSTLIRGRSGEELWRGKTVRVESPATGTSRLPVKVTLPSKEGVYTIRLKAMRPTGFLSKFPTTRSTPSPLAERSFQVAVLDSQQRPKVPGDWQETYTFDPRKPSKWARRAPSWMQLGNLPWTQDSPLSSEDHANAVGRAAVEIAPRTEAKASHWRAYPLPVERPGQAYAVEVEALGEPGDTLTLAVLEPDSLGDLRAISGAVTHTMPRWNRTGEPQMVRLVVRPRTDSPLLVVANPSKTRIAKFGKLRLLMATPTDFRRGSDNRLVALDWRDGDLPHTVGASHVVSPLGRYEQPDLQTFIETARTLAERVELAGANAAVVGVNAAGSAIYPSVVWKAPRYELGVWSDGAADLPRKELLRLIAFEFRRRGLRLIPAVRFDAPVVPLERSQTEADYLAGSPILAAIMRQIIDEVIDAVGDSEVLAGVAVRATDGGWGLLDPTKQSAAPERLAQSYRLLADELRSLAGDEAELIVLADELSQAATLRKTLVPRFGASDSRATETFEATGLRALGAVAGLRVAHPFGGQFGLPTDPRLAESTKLDLIRQSLVATAPIDIRSIHSDRHALRLADSAERLGSKSGIDVLLPATIAEPSAEASQLAAAAKESTRLIVIDGAATVGWSDQELTQHGLAFTRLPVVSPDASSRGSADKPAEALADSQSDFSATAANQSDGTTAVTVVNHSAWERHARITIETRKRIRGLLNGTAQWLNPGQHAIDLTLEPYESTVWRFDDRDIRVVGTRIEPDAEAQRELAEAVAGLQACDTTSRRRFAELPNPSFEQIDADGTIECWKPAPGVTIDSNGAFEGESSIRLSATPNEPAVLLSQAFPMPTTGQLAIGMRLRPGSIDPAAELRIDVLQVDGDYRNSTGLTGEQLNASGQGSGTPDWLPPIVFPIDDLPLVSDGLLQLRFTLTGTGELNVDNLEAEDLILPLDGFGSIELRSEKFALVRLLSASQSLLDEGRLEACRELLDSYWARFLIDNFPRHQAEEAIASDKPEAAESSDQASAEKEENASISQRLRGYLPRWWR